MLRLMGMLFLVFTPVLGLFGKEVNKETENRILQIYNSYGSSVHVNKSSAFRGQQAGYVTGGGVSISNSVYNKKPLKIVTPGMKAGCGGIDIHAGSLSFIDAKELENGLKNIVTASSGYAFMLAMDTMSPQMSNIMGRLQGWANDINAININSCELAQGLVAGAWPQSEMASRRVCQLYANGQGAFRDHNMTRHACSDQTKGQDVIHSMAKHSDFSNELIGEYNIVWEAIKRIKIPQSGQDKYEEKEAMKILSLTGSLIVRQTNDGKTEIHYLDSKIQDKSFIDALMRGGNTEIYVREERDDKCLFPVLKNSSISVKDSWYRYVEDRLISIRTNIQLDESLSEPDKVFIEDTRFPIYRAINVMTAYRQGECPLEIIHMAEFIACDLFAARLSEIISLVRSGCQKIKSEQMGGAGGNIDTFLLQLDSIEKYCISLGKKNRMNWQDELAYMEKVDMLEEEIKSRFKFE